MSDMDRTKCKDCKHRYQRVFDDPCRDCILIPSYDKHVVSGFKYEKE